MKGCRAIALLSQSANNGVVEMNVLQPALSISAVEATSQLFFTYFDWFATLLWATSGAMLAARRGYDFVGVFVVALVSAAGGGLLRDGLFLQDGPPVLVRSPVYLALISAAALLVIIFGGYLKSRRWFETTVGVVDAIGLGAYAVVGMNLAIAAHLPYFGILLVGLVNAVGGSILRDILIGRQPQLLKPDILLGIATLSGCLLFLVLYYLDMGRELAALLTVLCVFAVRMIAVRFNLRSWPLKAFEEDWRQYHDDPGNPKT